MSEAEAEGGGKRSSAVAAAEEEVRQLVIRERRRQIAARRALRIVLQLAKRHVTVDFLCLALNFIEPQHWEDAIDERNAESICGYALCGNKPLNSEGKKQKYRICSRTNQVYDMKEYNRFCSVWCAKASRHIREQISESPVSSREGGSKLQLSILDKDAATKKKEGNDEEAEEAEVKELEEAANSVVEKEERVPLKRNSDTRPSKAIISEPLPRPAPLDGAKNALRAWLSSESLAWLSGLPLAAKSAQEEEEASRDKVRRFLTRRAAGHGARTEEEEEVLVKLPLVDSLAQDAIRRRIVGEKLTGCLRDVTGPLGLELAPLRTPLQQLLRTFDLSATNIVLRPQEWRAAALLVLSLIGEREEAVRSAMEEAPVHPILRAIVPDGQLGLQELLAELDLLSLD